MVHCEQYILWLLLGVYWLRFVMGHFDTVACCPVRDYFIIFGYVPSNAVSIAVPQCDTGSVATGAAGSLVRQLEAGADLYIRVNLSLVDLVCIELLQHWNTSNHEARPINAIAILTVVNDVILGEYVFCWSGRDAKVLSKDREC